MRRKRFQKQQGPLPWSFQNTGALYKMKPTALLLRQVREQVRPRWRGRPDCQSQGGDGVEEEGQGEQATCSEEEEAPQITAEAACSAARALGISLSTMLELPMAEWDSQVKHMWKEATLKHHPDKGGTLEQFHQLQHSYKAAILWLGQYRETVRNLVTLFPKDFSQCFCLRCARLFNRRKKCEHCLGLHTNKGHDPNCMLQTGCLRIRKAYPKYWPYYLKLLAHGICHERAKEMIRECFELERSEAKQVRKCEREQKAAEEREASRRWMEGMAKKKQRIEAEVRQHYEKKQRRPQLLAQVQEDCDFDTEGIFETPGGGTSQIGGGTASGHQHEAVASLPLPAGTSHPSRFHCTLSCATKAIHCTSTSPPTAIHCTSTCPTTAIHCTTTFFMGGSGPHSLVSSLVHHVMNDGPYHVQFGGGWHTIPHEPAVFEDRERYDTARHLRPMCGHMSLRWEIYNVTSRRIWIRCTRFRRYGCTFQWYPPSNF